MPQNNVINKNLKQYQENYIFIHPNGKPMFMGSKKRAEWYIKKGLANTINDNKIQLTFIPNGNGFPENDKFGMNEIKLRCVVTGKEDELQKHHVVPYCYRRHFPIEFKSKNHHDVVFMHYKAHEEYEIHATQFKKILSYAYGTPSIDKLNADYSRRLAKFKKSYRMILSCMGTYFSKYESLPNDRKLQLLELISKNSNISYEKLLSLTVIEFFYIYIKTSEYFREELKKYKDYYYSEYDHGYHVVQKLDTEEKINKFIYEWRKHFLLYAKPKFLPKGWNINYRTKVNYTKNEINTNSK